jgi:glutamine amidotransferase
MIAIIDYKAGNLRSVERAFNYLNQPCVITADPEKILAAERVVFPGVGAAGSAMNNLRTSHLDDVLRRVIERGTPFLGICIGFQLLFESSAEDDAECLGVLPGRVVRFPAGHNDPLTGQPLKIPHMGWSRVAFTKEHSLFTDVPTESEFYFVHSYYPEVADQAIVCAKADYGINFACGVVRENVAAFQFHPEKSGRPGLKMLENFCSWN